MWLKPHPKSILKSLKKDQIQTAVLQSLLNDEEHQERWRSGFVSLV